MRGQTCPHVLQLYFLLFLGSYHPVPPRDQGPSLRVDTQGGLLTTLLTPHTSCHLTTKLAMDQYLHKGSEQNADVAHSGPISSRPRRPSRASSPSFFQLPTPTGSLGIHPQLWPILARKAGGCSSDPQFPSAFLSPVWSPAGWQITSTASFSSVLAYRRPPRPPPMDFLTTPDFCLSCQLHPRRHSLGI